MSKSLETHSSTLKPRLRLCRDCGLNKPENEYYFVDSKSGRRRGQCRDCVRVVKRVRRDDPEWRPACSRCGKPAPRPGKGGRRLCTDCHGEVYSTDKRPNGSYRLKLKGCWRCNGEKDRGERSRYCSACVTLREGQTEAMRRRDIFRHEYDEILASQGGGCAICGGEQRDNKLYAIDHDHSLGGGRSSIRGLLCDICNYQRLPLFRDDPGMLMRAINYLDNPPARSVIEP